MLYHQFTCMDVAGPLEAFATVSGISEFGYEAKMIGLSCGPVLADSGIRIFADYSIDDISKLDMLIIPGGAGGKESSLHQQLIPWLNTLAQEGCKIVSVCTGSFILAASGLLDGLRATTHWDYGELFNSSFDKIELVSDALYVDNGQFATSAGIASGIDLALKLIEDDYGCDVASDVARYLVVHFRRSGDQAQYSQPLKFQTKTDGNFSSLTGWILNHLDQDLSIEVLADRSDMSVRSFCRKFKQQTGFTPGKYVESLRLDYARQLLTEKNWAVIKVATACGYQNLDVFRRAFERRFSVSPRAYRENFQP